MRLGEGEGGLEGGGVKGSGSECLGEVQSAIALSSCFSFLKYFASTNLPHSFPFTTYHSMLGVQTSRGRLEWTVGSSSGSLASTMVQLVMRKAHNLELCHLRCMYFTASIFFAW
jgi:hypothetical protein